LKFTKKSGKKANDITVDGNLKMIKNQGIQLSLKAPVIGTEIFRITLTPSHLIIIDRWNKQYLNEPISELQKDASFRFDFYSFQALISNQLFIAGKENISPDNYSLFSIFDDQYLCHIENTDDYDVKYLFTSDYTNRIHLTEIYKEKEEAYIRWNYENFGLTDTKFLFPLLMKMELTLPDDVIVMNMSFNNVAINGKFELDTSFPVKYKPLGLQDVIKLIKSL
jgi:hypothetical protein